MRIRTALVPHLAAAVVAMACGSAPAAAADHNDPNVVNSIFADIPVSPADLYGMFGYPGDDPETETVVVQLTFASIPATGVFDPDMLYRILLDPDPRVEESMDGDSLEGFLDWAEAVKAKYLNLAASEIRVSFPAPGQARVDFLDFPGGSFSHTVAIDRVETIEAPGGHRVLAFVGGRDDPFFNDLPGFFRSINYVPQFYEMPHSMLDDAEAPIPKTLLELEGNRLFNFDPDFPLHGQGVKKPLPAEPFTWEGDGFARDENGDFRFVYSGRDAQAGMNVNAVAFELPLAMVTEAPRTDRVVRAWGESWVRTASGRFGAGDHGEAEEGWLASFWSWLTGLFGSDEAETEDPTGLARYTRIDTVGVPFLDAALSVRKDERQLGADNISLGRLFVQRLGHLGWGFGPSMTALGLGTCFDHGGAPVSRHETYTLATAAFPRAKRCLFQRLNMPDDSWQKNGVEIAAKRSFELFIPNVTAVDMDTNGTWPFGRRLEDQVATRFLSLFLDMEGGCGGRPCHIESLGDLALWEGAPIQPKTPPNPLVNDKEFLTEFPYLAEPWP